MKTMFSNLPVELAEEIISRALLKSMKTVKLTCKKWNELSKSDFFRKMHVVKAATTREGESMMVTMMNYNLYLMNVLVDHVDPSIKINGKLSCLEEQVNISNVFHCEGLLLCILKDDSRVVVCNPYLSQTTWIKPRYSHSINGMDTFHYALGYENKKSYRSVKLLRFIDYDYYWFKAPEAQFSWYDFDSGLWSTLDVTPNWRISSHLGVSLKGNTFWCAAKRSSRHEVDWIICFDFTKERFEPFMRLPFIAVIDDYTTLSCVREEKLAVLLQHNEGNPYELDIWITTKIDETKEISWIKFLRLETEFNTMVPFISGGFIIDEEKKVVMGFDEEHPKRFQIIGEAGYLRHLAILPEPTDPYCQPKVSTYVPGLVQIKQHARGKRKQESDLEKIRFDENMLRLAAFEENQLVENKTRMERIMLSINKEKNLTNISKKHKKININKA